LLEGVPAGRTIDIIVFKAVVSADEESALSGVNIGVGTMPLDRLAETVTTKEYVDNEINKIPINGKMVYMIDTLVAVEDGQREFIVPFDTFDDAIDVLKVYQGQLVLHKNSDFVVSGMKVVLTEGVSIGTTITMEVFKQIETNETEEYMSGRSIRKDSLPLDRVMDSNLKTYTSLEQIGITVGEETIDGIMASLPNNSMLMFHVTSSNNASQYPTTTATCIIYKSMDSRTSLTLEAANTSRRWFAEHYTANGNITWTGWKEIFTTEGGTLRGGDLFVSDGLGLFGSYNGQTYAVAYDVKFDNNNRRSLVLTNHASG